MIKKNEKLTAISISKPKALLFGIMIFLQWMKSSRLTKSTDSIEKFIENGDMSYTEKWAEKLIHEPLTLCLITIMSQQNKQSWSVLHESHASKISYNNIEDADAFKIVDVIIVCVEKKIFMHLVSSDFITHEEDFSYLLQKFYDIHKSELDVPPIKLHILQFGKIEKNRSSL